MRLDLPGGGWAELRDPETVKESQRRPLMRSVAKMSASDDQGEGMSEVTDALLLALVDSWSLPEPVSPAALLELPIRVYDALRAATMPLMKDVLPDFGPSPDSDSPTEPSSA